MAVSVAYLGFSEGGHIRGLGDFWGDSWKTTFCNYEANFEAFLSTLKGIEIPN